jgi:hypothetical protein
MQFNELTLGQKNKFSNPIEHIISCCELGLIPTQFDILNAKDELRKLKDKIANAYEDAYLANNSAREDLNRWLDAENDRAKLAEENKALKRSLENIVGWARVNDKGDLYDLRLQRNPHVDETIMLPLYANQEEFKKVAKRLKNAVDNADE